MYGTHNQHSLDGVPVEMGNDARACLQDTGQLRQRLIDTWSTISQGIIDVAIDQWRT